MLGPNGTGKTTLLKVLLGLVPLSAGTVRVNGSRPRRGNHGLGYVPQQQAFDRTLPDPRPATSCASASTATAGGCPATPRATRRRVDERARGRGRHAATPTPRSACSRAASSSGSASPRRSLGDPAVLLCDEPLLALDLASQRAVTRLIDERRRARGHAGGLRDPRSQPGPALRGPHPLPGARALGHRHPRRDPDQRAPRATSTGSEVDVVKVRDRYLVVSAEDELPTEPGRPRRTTSAGTRH